MDASRRGSVEAWKGLYWYRLLVGSVHQCLAAYVGIPITPKELIGAYSYNTSEGVYSNYK